MKFIGLFLFLIIALVLEVTLIQLPLVFLILFVIAVTYQDIWIFPVSLGFGLLLDGLTFRPLGESSLFFILFLLLVFLYERKFELRSIWFVIFMSCVGSLLFMYLFGHVFIVLQLFVSIFLGILLFFLFTFLHPSPQKNTIRSWKV